MHCSQSLSTITLFTFNGGEKYNKAITRYKVSLDNNQSAYIRSECTGFTKYAIDKKKMRIANLKQL